MLGKDFKLNGKSLEQLFKQDSVYVYFAFHHAPDQPAFIRITDCEGQDDYIYTSKITGFAVLSPATCNKPRSLVSFQALPFSHDKDAVGLLPN